jgi:hypothetical protein
MPLLLALILFAALSSLAALIGAALLYLGWNYGVLAAFPSHGLGAIGFWQAFCLALVLSVITSVFRFNRKRR